MTLYAPLPTIEGGWPCVLADPPWHFRARTALQMTNWTSRRDAEKHYAVMGRDDIANMPVKQIAGRDAHLFLWTTGPCLRMAFDVIEAWGFKYSSDIFVWVKTKKRLGRELRLISSGDIGYELHVGLGLTSRKNVEYVLLGRRGNCKRLAKDIRQVIVAPVREHSRKPDEIYPRIERYCVGPRLEIFGRQSRPGWTVFGNEATKFDTVGEVA